MRRYLIGSLVAILVLAIVGAAYPATVKMLAGLYAGGSTTESAPPPASITGITLGPPGSFTCGTASNVGAITVQGTGDLSQVVLSIDSTSQTNGFSLSSTSLPANLMVSATAVGCPQTYTVLITATQANTTGSPKQVSFPVASNSPPTWGTETTLGNGYGTIVASGNTLHIAVDNGDSTVHYRKSTDEGATWSTDRQLVGGAYTPTDGLAVNGSNVYIIYLNAGDVFFISSADAGTTWSSACQLSAVGNVYRISMAATASRVDVVWSVNASNGGAISYRSNSTSGSPCGSWTTATSISGSSTTAVRPRVASSGNNIHVVWESQDGGRPACYQFTNCPNGWYVRSTNGGSTFESPQELTNFGSSTAIIPRPEVSLLSSGNPVVTFHNPDPGDTTDANQQIYATVSSNLGAAGSWGTAVPAIQLPLNDSHPQTVGSGNLIYMLESNTDLNTQITAPWFSIGTGGTNWSAPEQVSTQNTYADMVAVTANYAHAVYSPFSGGPFYYRRRALTPQAPTIQGMTLSGPKTFACATGGTVGTVTIQGTGAISGATLGNPPSGADGQYFSLSPTTSPSTLEVTPSPPGCPRSYNISLIATLPGATGCDTGTDHCTDNETIVGTSPPTQVISSITPIQANFTASQPSAPIVTLTVAMNPATPPFSGTLGLCTGTDTPVTGCSRTNSGGFQLLNCSPGSGPTCTLAQSGSGDSAITYSDITAYAAQTGMTTIFQQLTLTGQASGSVITSADYFVPTTGTTPPGSKVPIVIGQVFRMGDVPSGNYPSVTDNSGTQLTYQMDMVSPTWPDGSMRHAVFTVWVPATTGNTHGRIKYVLQSGAYAPASTPRAISEITSHNYQIHYQGVETNPTGGTTGPFTWSQYGGGSGNYTCNINNLISANQYEIRANGPVRMDVHVYGFMSNDATSSTPDAHLYCDDWITLYTNPANTAQVMYSEHMPEISQPIGNPVGGPASSSVSSPDPNAHVVIGQASYCDGNSSGAACSGATKLRDFADDYVSFTNTNITPSASCSNGGANYTMPSGLVMQPHAGVKFHVVSGSAPTGISDGQIGFSAPYAGCLPGFGIKNAPDNNNCCDWPVTAAGSGNFQLLSQQWTPYYNGFYITQAHSAVGPTWSHGIPITQGGSWTPPAEWFPQPDLDGTTNTANYTPCAGTVQTSCTQKAYWEQTGMIPGWDYDYQNTIQSHTPENSSFSAQIGTTYVEGGNGVWRPQIDSTGSSWDTGPWPEITAVYFKRQGATGWTEAEGHMAWAAALSYGSLPTIRIQRRAGTGGCPDNATAPAHKPCIIPWDNGPDDAGAIWPNLGAPCANDQWYAPNPGNNSSNSCSHFSFPVDSNGAAPNWAYGVYMDDFSNYHWPNGDFIEYMFFGRDYLIQMVRGSGERSKLQRVFGKDNANNVTGDGKLYYTAISPICNSQGSGMGAEPWAAAILGPATDPEMPYLKHFMTVNNAFLQAFYNNQTPIRKALGACGGFQQGYNNMLLTIQQMWSWTATRLHGNDYIAKMRATQAAGNWDAPGNPPSGVGTWGVSVSAAPTAWWDTNIGGLGTDPDNLSAKSYGLDDPADGLTYIQMQTDGSFKFNTSRWAGTLSLVGGELIPFSLSEGCNGTCVPPSLLSLPENTRLYITNLNQSSGTFQVTTRCNTFNPQGVCTNPDNTQIITTDGSGGAGGSWTNCSYPCGVNVRPTADNGGWYPGGGSGEVNTMRSLEIIESIRGGITTDSTYCPSLSRANLLFQTRDPHPGASWCTVNSPTSGFIKNCMTTAVPVYPPLTDFAPTSCQ